MMIISNLILFVQFALFTLTYMKAHPLKQIELCACKNSMEKLVCLTQHALLSLSSLEGLQGDVWGEWEERLEVIWP